MPWASILWLAAMASPQGAARAAAGEPIATGESKAAVVADTSATFDVRELRPTIASDGVVRGVAFQFTPAAAATVTIDVRSVAFDAYLVVRADGKVVAEDDNGWMVSDPRLWLAARAGVDYTIEVLARRDGRGAFELSVRAGRAPAPSAAVRLARAKDGLAYAEATYGARHAATAEGCATLAAVLRGLGRADEALVLYQRALALRLELHGEAHGEVATAHSNLGNCLDDLGRFAAAQRAHETALAIESQASPPRSQMLAVYHNNLGTVLQHQGCIQAAAEHLRAALRLKESVFGPDAPELVVNLSNLGTVEVDLGHTELAHAACARAVDLGRKHLPGTQQQYLLALANLALVDSLDGREVEAIAALRDLLPQIESWNGKDTPMTALVQANLANLLGILGDTTTAIALHEQAGATLAARLGPDHDLVRTAQHPLAMVKLLAGDFAGGEAILGQLVRWMGERRAVFHLVKARLLAQHALALLMVHEPQAAVAAMAEVRALSSAEPAGASDVLGEVDYVEALAKDAAGDAAGALATLRASMAERRRRCATQLLAMPESERVNWLLRERNVLDLFLDLSRPAADGADAYAEVLAWKGLLARGLTQQLQWLRAQVDAAVVADVDRRRAVALALAAAGEPARRAQLVAERQELERKLLQEARGLVAPPPTPAALCAWLGEAEAVVDFLVLDAGRQWQRDPRTSLVAFVVRHDGVRRVDLGLTRDLDPAVLGFVQVTARRVPTDGATPPSPAALALGARLRQLLWEPLAPALRGATRVWLAPDGVVATLPFETLPGARDGTFLLEDIDLRYVDSGVALVDPRPPVPAARGVLLVGDVDYGAAGEPARERGGAYDPLPGTGAEIDALAALWPTTPTDDVATLRARAASEAAVRQAARGRAYVHLATHGRYFARPQEPNSRRDLGIGIRAALSGNDFADVSVRWPGMRSGVALAGANLAVATGGDDGFLSADEVAWLDLRGCRLATLSACETGLGAAMLGESLLGLRRALRLAGAQATLTSLWKVGDDSARALMTGFYARLWRDGLAPAAALRATKLDVLAALRARHAGDGLPGAWGGFVLESASR